MAKQAPELTFDIERTPPSAEAIAEQIRRHEADLVDIEKYEKVVRRKIAGPSGLLCLAAVVLWATGIIPWEWAGPLAAISAAVAWVAATRLCALSWVVVVAVVVGVAGASTARALYGEGWMLGSFAVLGFLGGIAAACSLDTVEQVVARMNIHRTKAKTALESLQPLYTSRCPKVLELCQQHPELAAYQSAVVATGRFLVNAEEDAMQQWVAGADSRKAEANRRAACQALKMPLATPVTAGAANLARHFEACTAMREAEEALDSALARLKSAAMTWVRAEADVSGDHAAKALVEIAASNRASWSGGCLNASNIVETAKRQEALALVRNRIKS